MTQVAARADIPVHVVRSGNIRTDSTDVDKRFVNLPLHVRNPDGSKGMGRRRCSVIGTNLHWLIMALHVVIKEKSVDLLRQVMERRVSVFRVGSVMKVERIHPPYVVLDPAGVEIVDVTAYLRDLALGDGSPLTGRSDAVRVAAVVPPARLTSTNTRA